VGRPSVLFVEGRLERSWFGLKQRSLSVQSRRGGAVSMYALGDLRISRGGGNYRGREKTSAPKENHGTMIIRWDTLRRAYFLFLCEH